MRSSGPDIKTTGNATVSPFDAAAAGAMPLKSNRRPPRRGRFWIERAVTRSENSLPNELDVIENTPRN
jgi:hypothetical protein